MAEGPSGHAKPGRELDQGIWKTQVVRLYGMHFNGQWVSWWLIAYDLRSLF